MTPPRGGKKVRAREKRCKDGVRGSGCLDYHGEGCGVKKPVGKRPSRVRAWALLSPSGKFIWSGSHLIVGMTKEAALVGMPWTNYVVPVTIQLDTKRRKK